MAELRQNISPGLLTNAAAPSITRRCRLSCSPEKERKYATFYNVNAHQDPDHLDVPPAPVWILKLPNSWKLETWSADEFGSCPAGPGQSSRRIIHKVVELAVALNLDSCYKVIRNRIILR